MSDGGLVNDSGSNQLSDIDRKTQIKIAAMVVGRVTIGWVLFIILYTLMPIGKNSISPGLFIIGMIIVFAGMITFALRRVAKAEMPQVRAAEVALMSVGFYLFAFAALYLSLSDANQSNFNTVLNQVNAFYFTVTVFTTVGFGDIAPTSSLAQLIVSWQMLLNLLFLYVGVRVILTVGKRRAEVVRAHKSAGPANQSDGEAPPG